MSDRAVYTAFRILRHAAWIGQLEEDAGIGSKDELVRLVYEDCRRNPERAEEVADLLDGFGPGSRLVEMSSELKEEVDGFFGAS